MFKFQSCIWVHWILFKDYVYHKLSIFTNICRKYLKILQGSVYWTTMITKPFPFTTAYWWFIRIICTIYHTHDTYIFAPSCRFPVVSCRSCAHMLWSRRSYHFWIRTFADIQALFSEKRGFPPCIKNNQQIVDDDSNYTAQCDETTVLWRRWGLTVINILINYTMVYKIIKILQKVALYAKKLVNIFLR